MANWQSFMCLHLKLLDLEHPLSFDVSKLRQIEAHALIYLSFPTLHMVALNDMFMIWTRSVQDLNTFTSFLNIHPTRKFTCDHSFTSIPLHWPLYQTYRQTPILITFVMSSGIHTKRAIPFSLALRLRRICSTNEIFTLRTN